MRRDVDVILEGPAIGGMCLLDVDHHEVGDRGVVASEPTQPTEVGHEWRSGAATEDGDERSEALLVVEQSPGLAVESQQARVVGGTAGVN